MAERAIGSPAPQAPWPTKPSSLFPPDDGGHSLDWRAKCGGPGSRVWAFEDAFAAYQDAEYGIATNSGTQALICALRAAGVGPGDEVIVSALSYFASATCAMFIGAVPVLADVDASYNMSAAAFEKAITDRTRAAVVVHNGGYPADMDAIMEVSRRRGVPVVEDCAHAHGSEWRGKRVGSIGDYGAFSLMGGKSLAGGEGGIILTNTLENRQRLYEFMDMGRWLDRPDKTARLDFTSNFRMPEFTAAVLLTQLDRLDEQIETRERNFSYLAEGLSEIGGVEPFVRDPRVTRWSIYYWNFRFNQQRFGGISRDRFLEAVRAEGAPISIGAHGQPIYENTLLQGMTPDNPWPLSSAGSGRPVDYRSVHCPEAERIYRTEALSISHRVFLGGHRDMDQILDAIRKVRDNIAEL